MEGGSTPDVGDLRGALVALPDRLKTLADLPLPSATLVAPDAVVICAAGDDALDAVAVRGVLAVDAGVPVDVHTGEGLPGFVRPGVLVVVVALTRVDARSVDLLDAAVAAGAQVVVVTASGDCAATATTAGAEVIRVDAGVVAPRVLPGIVAVVLLRILEESGVCADVSGLLDAMIGQASARTGTCSTGADGARRTRCAALARRLDRTMPLCYGGGPLGSVAADWWKSAVNQSAKLAAFARGVPEMSHDELAGFGQSGDVTRQIFTAVLLRHDAETAAVADQLYRVPELLEEVVAGIETVTAEGSGPLTQLVDLAIQGQWVGLEMAAVAGVDPSTVPLVDEFWASTPG